MVSFQLLLAAGAQRLSNGYGGKSLGNLTNPAQDIPFREVLLQATGADAFMGGDDQVTASVYGTKIDSTDLQPVYLFGDPGGVKLSDIWVAGDGATIHVSGIPL